MEISLNDKAMYEFFQREAKDIFAEFCGRQDGENGLPVCRMTQEGISKIYSSLQVIYSKEEAAQEVCLIDNVYEILSSFVEIKGMEHLLVNNYAAIENGIFLEHSAQGEPGRIREHYKHQFRNAYLGLLFLRDFHLDDCIADCIMDKKNEYAYLILAAISGDNQRYQLKEIIYKSFLVSALFHDVGYPLAYYFRMADEIHQFAPFFKIVNPAVKTVFAEIKAMLNNSWLFRTVEHDEIRKKYDRDDHGCLSAISFLMNFYFSGVIYSLDPKKQCIVEMAAVAIYKHTNQYHKNKRMIFSQDPVSYFLRMCDDLQENYIDICNGMRIRNDEDRLDIYLEYDCYRLLELMLSDYEAVIYRDRGLKAVENMFQCQKYLPQIRLHYFLSNNPAEIINEMCMQSDISNEELSDWLNSQEHMPDLKPFFSLCIEYLNTQKFGERIEQNTVRYAQAAKTFTEQFLGEIHSLWQYLKV